MIFLKYFKNNLFISIAKKKFNIFYNIIEYVK